MKTKNKLYAIIPARGGSKRIPKKNIKFFYGKPMIAWSILAAKKSKLFDDIIVSTDNIKIAKIAKKFGAKVPFLRPKKISDDFTDTRTVIAHAIKWIEKKNIKPNAICCIYATAPFIDYRDLLKGYKKLLTKKSKYVFSASYFPFSIFRSFMLNKNSIKMFFPNKFQKRSQDLPNNFFDAGMFYWAKPKQWLKKEKIFNKDSFPLLIERLRVNDIDTITDWKNAEKLAKVYLKQK